MRVHIVIRSRGLAYDHSWLKALCRHYSGDEHLVSYADCEAAGPADAERCDLIYVLHGVTAQTIAIPRWLYRLEKRGRLVVMTGNDYKMIEQKDEALRRLGPDLVATLAPGMPYQNAVHIPHGLDSHTFKPLRLFGSRTISVGFRGFRYPESIGDKERNNCVDAFANVEGSDIRWGILYGEDYVNFLNSCLATPATECGSPGHKAISSRHFEAIGCRAALIMYEGEYSGCLSPEHYVVLNRDHSNLKECVERVRDPEEWDAVTSRALAHALKHHTYEKRIEQIEGILSSRKPMPVQSRDDSWLNSVTMALS